MQESPEPLRQKDRFDRYTVSGERRWQRLAKVHRRGKTALPMRLISQVSRTEGIHFKLGSVRPKFLVCGTALSFRHPGRTVLSNRFAPFVARHIGPREDEIRQMLSILGYGSLDELTQAVVPSSICSREEAGLADAVSEEEALQELRSIASQNRVLRSFIGQGYYGTHTPNVIKRNVLENPAWYTAYTPTNPRFLKGGSSFSFTFRPWSPS